MIGPSETQTFQERFSESLDNLAAMLDDSCEYCEVCAELLPEYCKCTVRPTEEV